MRPVQLMYRLPVHLLEDGDGDIGPALRAAADDRDVEELVLEAGDVREVSAHGLGLLLGVSRSLAARGASLRLVGARPDLVRLLTSSGLGAAIAL